MDRITAPAIGVLSCLIITYSTNARAQPNHFVRAEYPVIGDPPGEQGIPNAVAQSRDGVVELGEITRLTVVDQVILFTAAGGQPVMSLWPAHISVGCGINVFSPVWFHLFFHKKGLRHQSVLHMSIDNEPNKNIPVLIY
jgi:hypothetical protein